MYNTGQCIVDAVWQTQRQVMEIVQRQPKEISHGEKHALEDRGQSREQFVSRNLVNLQMVENMRVKQKSCVRSKFPHTTCLCILVIVVDV